MAPTLPPPLLWPKTLLVTACVFAALRITLPYIALYSNKRSIYRLSLYLRTRLYISIPCSFVMAILLITLWYGPVLTVMFLLPPATTAITYHTIPVRNIPYALKVVHLSDLHYSPLDAAGLHNEHVAILRKAIDTCVAEKPDVVAITGDVIDTDMRVVDNIAQMLQPCKGKYGTFFVFGNHEGHSDMHVYNVSQGLQKVGVTVLINEAVEIDLMNEQSMKRLQAESSSNNDGDTVNREVLGIIGLADYISYDILHNRNPEADVRVPKYEPQSAFRFMHPDVPRIVLSHNPDSWPSIMQWRSDLVLAGHLHAGQLQIPLPGNNVAVLHYLQRLHNALSEYIADNWMPAASYFHEVEHWEWASGLFELKRSEALEAAGLEPTDALATEDEMSRMFVSSGLTEPYQRLFAPPEVAVLTLVPA